jgi:hypothetical protein
MPAMKGSKGFYAASLSCSSFTGMKLKLSFESNSRGPINNHF